MKFAPMKELLLQAKSKGIGLGAYVVSSYDTARAAILAGNETNIPVIFIAGTDCVEFFGGDFVDFVKMMKIACKDAKIPVALHLDHCRTYDECCEAVNAGFSSIMIDGSALPIEENIALTKKVVEFAHPLGITVEGELGRLIGEEGAIKVTGPEAAQTDPNEAKLFVEKTGIDCLAVSIGNQHGKYVAAPCLNIERLKKINDVAGVPIVLHGGSGTPIEQVQDAIKNGVAKINVATDVWTKMIDELEVQKTNPGFKYNIDCAFGPSREAGKLFIIGKMKDFSFQK